MNQPKRVEREIPTKHYLRKGLNVKIIVIDIDIISLRKIL